MLRADGTLENREKGTPQGGVCSPLLANIFMHHAFDEWMRQNYPQALFERYADDVLVHCKTEREAILMLQAIKERLAQCKLELHPEKTHIVYCKDDDRRKNYPKESFDFLAIRFGQGGQRISMGSTLFRSFRPSVVKPKTRLARP